MGNEEETSKPLYTNTTTTREQTLCTNTTTTREQTLCTNTTTTRVFPFT